MSINITVCRDYYLIIQYTNEKCVIPLRLFQGFSYFKKKKNSHLALLESFKTIYF